VLSQIFAYFNPWVFCCNLHPHKVVSCLVFCYSKRLSPYDNLLHEYLPLSVEADSFSFLLLLLLLLFILSIFSASLSVTPIALSDVECNSQASIILVFLLVLLIFVTVLLDLDFNFAGISLQGVGATNSLRRGSSWMSLASCASRASTVFISLYGYSGLNLCG